MTRLSDALDRAATAPPLEKPQNIPQAGTGLETPEVPWQFDRPAMDAPLVTGPDELRPEFGGIDEPAYRFADAQLEKLVISERCERSLVEQYRRLAAVFHHAQAQRRIRSIMVGSAVAGEGKTLTATNLALTFSHSYERRVLLIDADLRRPTLHNMFGIDAAVGLRDCLRSGSIDPLPLHQLSQNLWLLPAGRPDPDPMSGLVSDTMKHLLLRMVDQFDWVIVDTPPVGLMADANLLAAMIDAALMVVSAGTTPYPLARKAIEAIGASRVHGVVLNRVQKTMLAGQYGDYGHYYYGEEEARRP